MIKNCACWFCFHFFWKQLRAQLLTLFTYDLPLSSPVQQEDDPRNWEEDGPRNTRGSHRGSVEPAESAAFGRWFEQRPLVTISYSQSQFLHHVVVARKYQWVKSICLQGRELHVCGVGYLRMEKPFSSFSRNIEYLQRSPGLVHLFVRTFFKGVGQDCQTGVSGWLITSFVFFNQCQKCGPVVPFKTTNVFFMFYTFGAPYPASYPTDYK